MPSQPPSFGSQAYWNQRFISNSTPFEWLEEPTALDAFIIDALGSSNEPRPNLLHIGCGTSLLSYHLRMHVGDPKQIHNLDYSNVAIDIGKKREVEIFSACDGLEDKASLNTTAKTDMDTNKTSNESEKPHINPVSSDKGMQPAYMRWDAANLLDHKSILAVCKSEAYSVIVDKSTSDSIACADDIDVPLPYPVSVRSDKPTKLDLKHSGPLHPLHLMAVHLALVTKPAGRWISLSYSEDRYPFVNVFEKIPQDVIDNGFPDPGLLWKVVSKHELEAPEQQPPNENNGNPVTHRPRTSHWVYVLERTDVPIFIRGEHI